MKNIHKLAFFILLLLVFTETIELLDKPKNKKKNNKNNKKLKKTKQKKKKSKQKTNKKNNSKTFNNTNELSPNNKTKNIEKEINNTTTKSNINLNHTKYINRPQNQTKQNSTRIMNSTILNINQTNYTLHQNNTSLSKNKTKNNDINIQRIYPTSNIDSFTLHTYNFSNTSLTISPPINSFSSYSIDSYLFLFFGAQNINKYNSKVYLYDILTSNFQIMNYTLAHYDLPPQNRKGQSMSVDANHTFWFYGGESQMEGILHDIVSFNLINRAFSVESQNFKYNVTKSNKSRTGHKSIFINSTMMVVFGGQNEKGELLNDGLLVDIQNRTITDLNLTNNKTLPSPRENFIFIKGIMNNTFLIFGGNGMKEVYNDMFMFNSTSFTWNKINQTGEIPSPSSDMGYVWKNKTSLLVAGGCNYEKKVCYDDVYLLDLKLLKWSKILNKKFSFPPRGKLALMYYKDNLFVYGGCNLDRCYNDLYMMRITLEANEITNKVISNKTKENCEPKCQNGKCKKGKCICNPGYIGNSCDKLTILGKENKQQEEFNEYILKFTKPKMEEVLKNLTTLKENNKTKNKTKKSKKIYKNHKEESNLSLNKINHTNYINKKSNKTDFINNSTLSDETQVNNKTKNNITFLSNSNFSLNKNEKQNLTKSGSIIIPKFYRNKYGKENLIPTSDCVSNCSNHGICLNHICYCSQPYTGVSCSVIISNDSNSEISTNIFLFLISFSVALFTLIFSLSKHILSN